MSIENAILELAASIRYHADNAGLSCSGPFLTAGLGEQIKGVVKDAEVETAVKQVEEDAKQETKPKAEVKKSAAGAVAKEAPAPSVGSAKEPESAPLDYTKDVQPLLVELGKVKGREAVKNLLTKFGVAKGNELKADQFDDVVAEANTLMAAD